MKKNDILHVITDKMVDLPDSQKVLGEYILNNHRKVANLSALDLGNKVGVSDATVIRFAKSLGLLGYAELKKELFECLTQEDNPFMKMIKSLSRVKQVDSAVTEVFQNDIRNIQETFKSLSEETLKHAVNAIFSARRIYVIGLNSCGSLASFLNFHLRRLHLDMHLILSAGFVMFEQLAPINSKDVLVIFSYPRYSRDSLHAVEMAKGKGATTISITDKLYSPIAQASDIALIAHSTSPGFYNSYAAATTICNVLVLSLAFLNEEKSLQALKAVEEINKDMYL